MLPSSVIGILSARRAAHQRKQWNDAARQEGLTVCIDVYPTAMCMHGACHRVQCLHQRLGEMFYHGRAAYVMEDASLQEAVMPLLDLLEDSAQRAARVSVVINDEGILKGHWIASDRILPYFREIFLKNAEN